MVATIVQGTILSILFVIGAYTDIKRRVIPDEICILILLMSLIQLEPVNWLGIFCALPFLIGAYLCDGFGGGDVKLMASSGMILGFTSGILAMIMALFIEVIFYMLYSSIQKLRKQNCVKSLPLAPFLAIGVLSVYIIKKGGLQI